MEATLFVDVSVQNVHTDHAGVHGVGILLHSSLGHRFPRVAVDVTQKILEITFRKKIVVFPSYFCFKCLIVLCHVNCETNFYGLKKIIVQFIRNILSIRGNNVMWARI